MNVKCMSCAYMNMKGTFCWHLGRSRNTGDKGCRHHMMGDATWVESIKEERGNARGTKKFNLGKKR